REALEVYNGFKDSLVTRAIDADGNITKTDPSENYEDVVKAFRTYVKENKDVYRIREAFNNRRQRPGESFSNWYTDLKLLIKDCDYKDVSDSMMRCHLIGKTTDPELKKTLLANPGFTMVQIEATAKDSDALLRSSADAGAAYVDSVTEKKVNKRTHTQMSRGAQHGRGDYRGRSFRGQSTRGYRGHYGPPRQRGGYHRGGRGGYWGGWVDHTQSPFDCERCDTRHKPNRCPAYGKECFKCGGFSHFEKCCKTKKPRVETITKYVEVVRVVAQPQAAAPAPLVVVNPAAQHMDVTPKPSKIIRSRPNAYLVDSFETEEALLMEKNVDMVTTVAPEDCQVQNLREYTEVLQIQGKHFISFKLDCGSQVNLVPYELFCEINAEGDYTLKPSTLKLAAFNETVTPVDGSFLARVQTKYGVGMEIQFEVSKSVRRPLLGIEACFDLNLLKRVNQPVEFSLVTTDFVVQESKDEFIAKNRDVFEGLGQFKQTIHLAVDKDVAPGMCPPRRYSFAIADRLKAKLDSLASQGIIAKEALIQQKYPIPTLEEISCKVRDKAVFTVMDLRDGFWHANLDDESSLLCSFATPFGIYKFKRMPFGLSCAPELFQYLTGQVFGDTGARVYFDDVLVAGKDVQEHDLIMSRVLAKARSENVKFNPNKIQFRQTEVMFLGLLWAENKIRIDPSRTAAIQAIKPPQSKHMLQRVCGVFNHLRKFIPQMGTISAPLCDLLSSGVTFQWLPVHDVAFQKLKDCVSNAPVLVPFDHTKALVEYLPGKYMYLADLLSRNYIEDPVDDDPEMVEVVHEVTSNISISPEEAMPYSKLKDDLFVEDGLVILEEKVVVPPSLRPKVLKALHLAHLGIDKTKTRARQTVYWPGTTNDTQTLLGECRTCERNSPANHREPLIPHAIPELRFQKVGADILEFRAQPYLVVVDNYSKWLEIKRLASKSSSSVITVLREVFSTHGIPEIIYGENNPLDSYECREYASSIGSSIVTSSPEYPRSNGLAEKGVHIAKQLLKKCSDTGTHYLDGLREYNDTPLTGMAFSPSQILMSRMVRTCVPTRSQNLEPRVVDLGKVPQVLQNKVKYQHDRRARRKPVEFTVGQPIVYWRGRNWYKGTVVEKLAAP
ncbi:hypothetical protein FOCC_FOCC014367, partial [Frankliniella occidentalis]